MCHHPIDDLPDAEAAKGLEERKVRQRRKIARQIIEELKELLRCRADALELKEAKQAVVNILKANED